MPDPKGHRPAVNEHEWIRIAVGRVCQLCMTVQVDGEFDDSVPCEPENGKPRSDAVRDCRRAGRG